MQHSWDNTTLNQPDSLVTMHAELRNQAGHLHGCVLGRATVAGSARYISSRQPTRSRPAGSAQNCAAAGDSCPGLGSNLRPPQPHAVKQAVLRCLSLSMLLLLMNA